MPVSSAPPDEGDDAPRQTHNFAPTYRGLVYRAIGHDGGKEGEKGAKDGGEKQAKKAGEEGQGAGVEGEGAEGEAGEGEGEKEVQYKLQTMKWGSYHLSRSFPFYTVTVFPSFWSQSFLPQLMGRSVHLYIVVPSFWSRSLFPPRVDRSFLR